MDYPYRTPHSFHPNAPPSSSSLSVFPNQQEVPPQRIFQHPRRQEYNITHESHQNLHQRLPYNGTPSVEQRAAIINLQAIPQSAISSLESFRSFLRGEQEFYPNSLSPQQCEVLFALTEERSDEVIFTWLNAARSPDTLVSSQSLYDSSILCNDRVAAGPFAQSPPFVSNVSIRNTPRDPFSQCSHGLSRGYSVALPGFIATSSDKHDHWCFVCVKLSPIKTCDGFKRHLREHYTRYYCIPQQPLVYTEDGPRCAFCNISNPDVIHLNKHSVSKCVGRKFTRKRNLIEHLKDKHDVHDSSVLADQSEYSFDIKYFACGFCIFCCGSLNELANHIDIAHYRFSEHIRDWDHDKVIRGLLSQPVVNEGWRGLLAANPHVQESWFRWNPTLVKQLKHRLEMSREPAEVLCKAAIDASNYSRSRYGYLELVPVTGLTDQETATDQSINHFRHQDAPSPLSYNSEKSYTDRAPRTVAPALQSQPLAMDWAGLDESRICSQIATETYAPHGSAIHHHADHSVRHLYPSNSGESFMQHHHSAYMSSTASTSATPQALEGHGWTLLNTGFAGHQPGLSPNVATSPRSGRLIETRTHPAQAHASLYSPTSTIQSTTSHSSRDPEISPLCHLDDTYSPRYHPALTAQSSRQEPTHHHGMDTESDSVDQQSFRQARGRSRRQRPNR